MYRILCRATNRVIREIGFCIEGARDHYNAGRAESGGCNPASGAGGVDPAGVSGALTRLCLEQGEKAQATGEWPAAKRATLILWTDSGRTFIPMSKALSAQEDEAQFITRSRGGQFPRWPPRAEDAERCGARSPRAHAPRQRPREGSVGTPCCPTRSGSLCESQRGSRDFISNLVS